MGRFLSVTWLPTVVFAALSRVGGWEVSCGWVIYLGPTLTAIALVPPVWYGFVASPARHRKRRGALAGAALTFAIFASSMQIANAWFWAHNKFPTDAFGEGMGNGLSSLFIMGALVAGAPVG